MTLPESWPEFNARVNREVSRGPNGDIPPSPGAEVQHGDAWEGPQQSSNGHIERPNERPSPAQEYLAFPLDVLAEPVRGYVDACSAAIGCDPAYIALPMLSTLAGPIGNTRRIQLKRGWSEPPILWTAIVGESGQHKSPALDYARCYPRRRQAQARKRYGAAMDEYQEAMEQYQAALKEWKQAVKNGETPLRPKQPEEPVLERALVDDTTIEALGPILLNNWRGTLVMRDELSGWLGCMDRYAKSVRGGGEAAKWLEMHGGRSLTIDRKTGQPPTLFVPRAAASIAGGIQPGILSRLITQDHRDNGLLARLLMAWPPKRPRRWTEAEPDERLTEAVQSVYDRLWQLKPATDRDGEPTPVLVPLTRDAKDEYIGFVNTHGAEQYQLEGDLAAAWSKLEGYAARLALIHHLVRWAAGDRPDPEAGIDAESIRAGIQLVRWFGIEDRRIYAMLAEDTAIKDRRELLDLIRRRDGSITARQLQQVSRRYPTAEAAEAALAALATTGLAKWETVTSPRGGWPTRVYRLV